jgi:hypothetical protein
VFFAESESLMNSMFSCSSSFYVCVAVVELKWVCEVPCFKYGQRVDFLRYAFHDEFSFSCPALMFCVSVTTLETDEHDFSMDEDVFCTNHFMRD